MYIYIYIYMLAPPPPPFSTHLASGRLVFGRGGTPDSRFPEKIWSTGAPDSRLQISRKNLEYRGPGLQTPDFQKKSGVPGPGTPDFFWKSGVRGPGESGRYSRFFLEIWSLESEAPVLQIFSGNLESGVRGLGTPESGVRGPVLQIFSGDLESGVRGPGTPDFFGNLESGVRGPCSPYARLGITV